MKTLRAMSVMGGAVLATVLEFSFVLSSHAEELPQGAGASGAYSITERGPHHRVWERIDYETSPSGRAVPKVHRYTELGSGMHYQRDGQWVESQETIEVLPLGAGAAASQGQHKVYFPPDIYQGMIELQTPDGQWMRSRPLGISYFDGTNSVLIAELTNSVGQILPSGNQMIYLNAFTDFAADLVCTYRKSGFECDLVFREQPPSPEQFGLNPATSRLELLTEFFDTPETAKEVGSVNPQDGLADTMLKFGSMWMGRGKAFLVGDSGSAIRVYKSWETIEGRAFLIEEVPYKKIISRLQTLPLSASAGNSVSHKVVSTRLLPAIRLAQRSTSKVQLAKAGLNQRPGVVLDYVTLNGTTNSFTFKGDTTYYLSWDFNVSGLTIFEGGTVIKFPEGGSSGCIGAEGGVTCKTGPYRPAVFTSKNDNSVGEAVSGSTTNPATGGVTYLWVGVSSPLRHLRFSYASFGVGGENCDVSDSQFFKCGFGLDEWGSVAKLHNVLFAQCDYGVMQDADDNLTVRGEHITMDQCDGFIYETGGTYQAYLTNSLFTAVGQMPPSPGTNNSTVRFFASNAGIYQTVGSGSYYLADNSTNRNAGTTNINSTLLAELRQKTTYSPMVYSNVTITTNLTLGQYAWRDTNALPDLGYHYEPIDYAFGGTTVNSNLTFIAGTVAGWFRTSSGWSNAGHGIHLADKAIATFDGRVDAPAYWVRCNTVQEGGNGLWNGGYGPGGITCWAASPSDAAVIQARFLRCAMLNFDGNHFRDDWGYLTVRANHCEFWSGSLGGYCMSLNLTNSFFDRCSVGLQCSCWTSLAMRNCTMHGGQLLTERWDDVQWTVWIENCALDGTAIQVDDLWGDSETTYCDYNAYTNRTKPFIYGGAHDVVVSNGFNWQTNLLGYYYQSINSPLTNKGSCTADVVGLYHFTTQTNQVKETNSAVDIGYHYVALANGVPVDSYWIGIPDYLADSNGDGSLGVWLMHYFGNLGIDPYADYDSDGTNNLQEHQNSTDPNKINFSFAFPNQYVTTNIVTGTIAIFGGVPNYYAVLVDSTNFAGAVWTAYSSSNITVDISTNQGAHDVWVGLRGLPTDAYQTWEETTLILNSAPPTISITNPVNNVSLNASRVNVSGSFTAVALKQITIKGVRAFVDGTNFEALNVTLDRGTNTLTATIEDLTGETNTASITVTGLTNADGSMNNPVQLQATPLAGFAPLQVTFQITSNGTPGTIQQVFYDFNGDDIADLATNSLDSLTYTYATNGEYFPVVTVQTTSGRFSSIGGWNAVALDTNNQPIRINVQMPPMQTTLVSITDPVDLKWDGTHLYVLSRSTATITEFATNGTTIRSLSGIGTNPSGLDVDGDGNVYVALTGNNQVWKFHPTNSSFQADTTFGIGGCIGLTNGATGTGTNEFNAPFDVAVTPDSGTISVSDSGNHRIQRFSATSGAFIVAFGSQGSAVGQFNTPKGLSYDSIGTLYIVDSGNNRIVLAQDAVVLGVTGMNGAALGQFSSPMNLSVGERGVYVADTGNNRVQKFDPPANGLFSITASGIGYAITTNLIQPAAVAAVDSLTNELFYVADTGNNRVILCKLPDNHADAAQAAWTIMVARVAVGDMSGAAVCFSSASVDGYRQAFLSAGTANTISAINQIGTLTQVFVKNDTAEFYFEQEVIAGQTITFPVEFIKENGVWKILEF